MTSQTRIPILTGGNIDLECGSTTNSVERQKQVSFAPTYFMTGTKIVVKKSSGIKGYDDLKGKTVVFTTGTTNEITKEGNTGYRVIGYAVAFKNSGRIRPTNITESLNPAPWKVNGQDYDPGPSARVVAADGTISEGENELDRTKNKYTKIDGGWKGHQAPHINGKVPSGGNLLMLDGHAEWRKFQAMKVRTTGGPAFWW